MGNLTRVLIVWVLLFALALTALFLFNHFGEQVVQRVQAESVLAQGEALESAGRIDKAIALYEKHRRPRLLPALARAYMKTGRFHKALDEAHELVDSSTDEDKAHAYLLLGRLHIGMGLRDEAYADLDRAVEIAPKSAEVHYEIAKAAEARRMYHLMLDELETTADLKTRDSSETYRKEYKRRKEAVRNLKKQTGSGTVFYSLGIMYKELGEWNNAVDAFGEAAKFDDAVGDVFFWLGVDAEIDKRLDDARVRYLEAVERAPAHFDALVNLNRVRLLEKVESQSAGFVAWYNLGVHSFDLDNWTEARDAFRKAVKINPKSADCHAMLGRTLEKLGLIDEARKEYKESVRISPIHPDALHGLKRTMIQEQNAE